MWARGLRIHGLLRSRTLRWPEIAHVRRHQITHRVGRWRIDGGMTVLIERRDGSTPGRHSSEPSTTSCAAAIWPHRTHPVRVEHRSAPQSTG